MTEKKFTPETDELAEETLEKVAGGESNFVQWDPNDPGLYLPTFIPNKNET